MSLAPERPPESTAGQADPFAGWDSVPLFMKSLPEDLGGQAKGDGEEASGDTLAALQALVYEGEPTQIAAGFKEQGNELFVKRKFKDAIGFYTRALDEVGKDLPVEDRRTLWCNRAAASLELGNLGTCLKDLSLVLSAPQTYYPEPAPASWLKTTQKALLRSARALSGLEKLPEAMDALERLQLLETEMGEPEKDVGKVVREQVQKKMDVKARKEAEKAEKERRKKEGDKAIREALTQRGALLPPITKAKPLFCNCPIDVPPPHFDPDSLGPESSSSLPLVPPTTSSSPFVTWQPPPLDTPLILPVFLLLPLAQPPTRDLCLGFHTSATFGDALISMEHDPASTQLYVATKKGKVLKVGSKLTLEKVLAAAGKDGDGLVLQEGWALEMVGVPKTSAGEDWVQTWKAEVKSGAAALL